METPTPFDLNRAITLWREHLERTPGVDGSALVELEAHLRESVASLEARSLSTEEAFWIASRRLGSSDALQTEFRKLNPIAVWADRGMWALLGLQFWIAISNVSSLLVPFWTHLLNNSSSYFGTGQTPTWLTVLFWVGPNTAPTLIAVAALFWLHGRFKSHPKNFLNQLLARPKKLFALLLFINLICFLPSATFPLYGNGFRLEGMAFVIVAMKYLFEGPQFFLLAATTFWLARKRLAKTA